MGLAEASDMVTDYLSAFQEEASQAGRMADVLSYAQANSNTSTQQLGEAFKNCAVNANNFGLDIEQTTALLGKLGDQGLKGSEAGTALNAVIRDMSSKMKDGAIQIGNTSVKITDANGNFKSMAEIVAGVQEATDGLSESEKMAALQSTFTADSIKAMGILLNTGADDIEAFTNELYNSNGAASEMAETMNDNLSGQITALGSALEAAGIAIGNALLPVIKPLVEWIQNLVAWFNNLSPTMQTTIVVIGGIVAAIGPVLLIIGQLCISLGGLITFFSAGGVGAGLLAGAIGLITSPVGIVIAIITALIAVGVLLYKNWDTIKAKCSEIWQNSIKPIITNVTNAIKSVLTSIWNAISSFLSTCWNGMKSVVTTVWNAIKSVTTTVWNAIKAGIQVVLNAIKSVVTMQINSVKTVVTTVWNAIKSVTTTVWNGIKSAISSVWSGIKSAVSTGVNAVKSVITSVWNTLESILTAPFKAAQSVISGILGGISSAVSKVTSAIKSVTNLGKSMPNPNESDIQTIDLYNEDDYSNIEFNYAKARQTSLSDVAARNQSIVNSLESFSSDVNDNKLKSSSKNYEQMLNKLSNIKKEIVVPVNINGREFARVIAEYTDVENGQRISFSERGLVL